MTVNDIYKGQNQCYSYLQRKCTSIDVFNVKKKKKNIYDTRSIIKEDLGRNLKKKTKKNKTLNYLCCCPPKYCIECTKKLQFLTFACIKPVGLFL